MESASTRLEDRSRRYRQGALGLVLFSAVYTAGAVTAARTRMLWTDELLTLYTSSLHDWREISELLAHGGEFHPPFFYALEAACTSLFGATELGLRLPAIAGVWLMSVCLFTFLRRYVPVAASLAGACFPLITSASYFATEARGYALVLGFGCLALVGWDRYREGRRRVVPLLIFAFSLAAAVAASYYGTLLVIPFGIAQAFRCRRRRSADLALWCALGAALIPLTISNRMIHSGARAVHDWPAPPWTVAIGFYADLLQPAVIPMVFFAALVVGRRLLRINRGEQSFAFVPPREHLALAFLFLGFSFWVILAARLATNAFALRYAIPAVIGVGILTGFAAARISVFEQRTLAGIVVCYAIVGVGWRDIGHSRSERAEWDASVGWLGTRASGSILVVDAIGTFLKLSHYGPPQLRSNITLVADPARAQSYGVDGSMEHALLLLNPWFRLQVAGYDAFIRSHDDFLILSDHWKAWADWQWVTRALAEDGLSVTLQDQHGQWLLYRVIRRSPRRK